MTPINSFRGEFFFLSNFYPSPVYAKGRVWPTVEHGFQASKSSDRHYLDLLSKTREPAAAKRLGRKVALPVYWWEANRVGVMRHLLLQKFHPSRKEAHLLLATGDRELIEGNHHHDNFWGRCDCTRCQTQPHHNTLGQLLMGIRAGLVGGN